MKADGSVGWLRPRARPNPWTATVNKLNPKLLKPTHRYFHYGQMIVFLTT